MPSFLRNHLFRKSESHVAWSGQICRYFLEKLNYFKVHVLKYRWPWRLSRSWPLRRSHLWHVYDQPILTKEAIRLTTVMLNISITSATTDIWARVRISFFFGYCVEGTIIITYTLLCNTLIFISIRALYSCRKKTKHIQTGSYTGIWKTILEKKETQHTNLSVTAAYLGSGSTT